MRPITDLTRFKRQRFLSRAFTGIAHNGTVHIKLRRDGIDVDLTFTPEQADMWADFLKTLAAAAREQSK